MIVVGVRSLPFDPPLDVPAVLRRVCAEAASCLDLPAADVTATWQTLQAGHYAVDARLECAHGPSGPPLLVDIQLPDHIAEHRRRELMSAVADSLVERTSLGPDCVRVQLQPLGSGCVMDRGMINRW